MKNQSETKFTGKRCPMCGNDLLSADGRQFCATAACDYNKRPHFKFREMVTACGNVFRCDALDGYRLELTLDGKTLQVITDDSRCATFDVSGGELWMTDGEDVIADWSEEQCSAVLAACAKTTKAEAQ